jgi:hypothetical protein
MKKIFAFILSAGLIAAIGTISNSCAPSPPMDGNDLYLAGSAQTLNLTRTDSALMSYILVQGCTCTFGPLIITGYGGDTSKIHFNFLDSLDWMIRPHTLQATIFPSAIKNSGSDSAWIELFYKDQSAAGASLYDTIRAYASY